MKNESNINQNKGLKIFIIALCTLVAICGGILWVPESEQTNASTGDDFGAAYSQISSSGTQTGSAYIFPSSPVEGVEEPDGDTGEGQPTGEGVPRPTPSLQVRATAKPNTKVQSRGVAKAAISKPNHRGKRDELGGSAVQEHAQQVNQCYRVGESWKEEPSKYAWSLNPDKLMIMTFIAEGDFNLKRRSDLKGANGYYDWGICQINEGYHKKIVRDPRFFTDWKFQVEQCVKLYKGGTTFYGQKRLLRDKKYYKQVEKLITCN